MKTLTANDFSNMQGQFMSVGSGQDPHKFVGFSVVDDLILQRGVTVFPVLEFVGCSFQKGLTVKNLNGYRTIKFVDCTFHESVLFEYLIAEVTWKECLFLKDLTLSGSQGAVSIGSFDILGNLILHGSYSILVNLIAINVGNGIQGNPPGNLKIGSCRDIKLQQTKFSTVEFDHSVIDNELVIEDSAIELLRFMHLTIGNWAYIKKSTLTTVRIDNLQKDHRYIQFSSNCAIKDLSVALHMVDQLEIFECQVGSLLLKGTNSKCGIATIRTPDIKELKFDGVFNEGRLTFIGIISKGGSKLSFLSSNIGKTDFIACNFLQAELEFKNSKVSEIFLAEANFPKEVVSAGEVDYGQTELLFGQLTTAAERQGHTAWALEFHAREIEAHYNLLPIFWDSRYRWIPVRKISFIKFSLWLNKISSNFGRSWIRAAAFSIGLGLVFFYLLVVTSHNYTFGFPVEFDSHFVPAYFRFMNPIRFIDLESLFSSAEGKPFLGLKWWSYIIDFFGRIVIAYGYYQTIQAFRRYGRK